MTKYKFSSPPWLCERGKLISAGDEPIIWFRHTIPEQSKRQANESLICLSPTLHEVVTKCQAVLSKYLEPGHRNKENVIIELLDILDDKELVIKLKELEV